MVRPNVFLDEIPNIDSFVQTPCLIFSFTTVLLLGSTLLMNFNAKLILVVTK